MKSFDENPAHGGRCAAGRRTVALGALAAFLLVVSGSPAHAGNPPPPEGEWWKRAKEPKRRGPVTWSIGFLAGRQNWQGLDDLSPTAEQRAIGWRGQFDPTSGIYGIDGWVRAARFGTIDLGFDLFVDRFSNSTSEPASRPGLPFDPLLSYEITSWRLGVAARSVFLTASRLQPTTSIGVALDYATTTQVLRTPTSPVVSSSDSPTYSLDGMLTVGCDVALERDPAKGWRARLDLGVERRPYDAELWGFGAKSPGVLAYKAEFGFVYRHRPQRSTTTGGEPAPASSTAEPPHP